MDTQFPKIGVGVLILNKNKQILLGKRKNAHGNGSWATPGGHLHPKETPETCAKRETLEETGLIISEITPINFSHNTIDNNRYMSLILLGLLADGTLENKEPHKCEGWEWFDWNNPPSPLFDPIKNTLSQKLYYDLAMGYYNTHKSYEII